MDGAQKHRGPDEQEIYRDARCGLAHTRNSNIDIAVGAQPMVDADDELVIAYIGEVFFYIELRAELVAAGARFRTLSDTEVVLQAYRTWGIRALERFNGQFAFAIWDRVRRQLELARDRLGVRPLYLCEHAGGLAFP